MAILELPSRVPLSRRWRSAAKSGYCLLALCVLSIFLSVQPSFAQLTPSQPVAPDWDGEGDAPDAPGPLASDLSAKLMPDDLNKAMRKVADWQLQRAQSHFTQDWSFAALYTGLMAASRALPEPKYEDAVLEVGKKYHWDLGVRDVDPTYQGHGQALGQTYDANNQGMVQSYAELYQTRHEIRMIGPSEGQFDELMTVKDNPAAPAWWWCDALFMAAPSWVRLYTATGDRNYLDYMDRQWWATSNFLYDPQEHLYFRDSNFITKREQNGRKVFWSRGNGWVMAGLVRVLDGLPKDYPARPKYVAQYKEMAARMVSIQGVDGLWRPGLLDPQAYDEPEVSGSGFIVYALAWGVNQGILDRKTYMPVIQAGWQGMLSHVYADGRLGDIQPIAGGPGNFKPSSSYVYGVGAFLLAGSELHSIATTR